MHLQKNDIIIINPESIPHPANHFPHAPFPSPFPHPPRSAQRLPAHPQAAADADAHPNRHPHPRSAADRDARPFPHADFPLSTGC